MNHMESYYWSRGTEELRRIRSQKYNRRLRLREKGYLGYLDAQELKTLNYQIDCIDRVIDARNSNARFE